MKIWTKILLFFPIWLFFLVVFYGVVLLLYPAALTGSKTEFNNLFSSNYGFMLLSQIAIFFGTFSAIIFVSKILDKQKLNYLSSMFNSSGLLSGIVLGTIEILLIILILALSTKLRITFNGISLNILIYALVFFIVAITEEALSRGFIFANLYNQTNKYLAIILSSIIFSMMHAFNSFFSWAGMANIVLIGIFSCQLYLKKMNLSIPIGFHFIWNFLQGPVFGFSVSGLSTQGIFKIESFSSSGFPFEGFGLEGSLITTFIISFFIVYFYVTNTRKIISADKLNSLTSNEVNLEIVSDYESSKQH